MFASTSLTLSFYEYFKHINAGYEEHMMTEWVCGEEINFKNLDDLSLFVVIVQLGNY